MLRMAECLGEEMASELGRQSWRGVRDVRRGERGGESPAGQSGDDSVVEKIRRLTERIDELEGKDKKKGEGRVVKGYSSESDGMVELGGTRWIVRVR